MRKENGLEPVIRGYYDNNKETEVIFILHSLGQQLDDAAISYIDNQLNVLISSTPKKSSVQIQVIPAFDQFFIVVSIQAPNISNRVAYAVGHDENLGKLLMRSIVQIIQLMDNGLLDPDNPQDSEEAGPEGIEAFGNLEHQQGRPIIASDFNVDSLLKEAFGKPEDDRGDPPA